LTVSLSVLCLIIFMMKLWCDQCLNLQMREHGFGIRYFKLAWCFHMQL
jgi:hypothetical protein